MAILAGDCRSTAFIVLDESYDDLQVKTHVKQIKINEFGLKQTFNLIRQLQRPRNTISLEL